MVAFVGLEGDVQSLSQDLQIQVHSKLNRALGFATTTGNAERRISPRALASITSHLLYQRRGGYYIVFDSYAIFVCHGHDWSSIF
jgi:20S proteasome alpha/beta subunit